jgi:AcrR family transcriptional regulator
MSLLEEHKAERRARIIRAARELVSKHGYEGLTMRDLADAARVSVPTLYNLFGSKDAILVAGLGDTAVVIASRMLQGGSFFVRAMAAFEGVMDSVLEQPAFFRAVMTMFLTSPESGDMRRRSEDGFIAIMTANLVAAQKADQVVEWVEPALVARHMYGQYSSCFMAWAIDELDDDRFRAAAMSGICHLLVGITRGPFHAETEARLKKLHRESAHLLAKETRHAAKSRSAD